MTSPFPLESKRLRFDSIREHDLQQVVEIYNSNPFYLQASTGKSDATFEEVRKDWEENHSFANSYSILLKEQASGDIVGLSQFILENPRDKNPWLGLLMLHKEKQGLGFAGEFLEVLLDWYKENGYPSLHLAVLEKNDIVLPFYEKYGFVPYEKRDTERWGIAVCMKYDFSPT